MGNRYEVVVDDDTYELFREAASHVLPRDGFEVRFGLVGMESPSVSEFRKGENFLILQAVPLSGGDMRVVVESETLDVETLVSTVVEEAVLRLVSILGASLDESHREDMARDLRDLLRSLPPGKETDEEQG
jgi:hypothetical protein